MLRAQNFCTQKLETQMHWHRKTLTKYFTLQSLHKVRPSTTLYYKACKKCVPVLLCTTKLAQSTSQFYFAVPSLHKVRPSTSLYYKACTKYVPVLLSTTKLAQNTSQYFFVLQSLHEVLPSTTLYYKAHAKYFPSANISLLQPWCHSNTIYDVQLRKTTLHCDLQPESQQNAKNHAHMNNHSLQNTEEEPITRWNDPSRTRRTHEVPFIAGCSHFTRKNTSFVLRLSPQIKAHATFMQPWHCDLQPESQQTHRIAHTWTTTCCRTQRRNRLRVETIQAAPATHTRRESTNA